MAHNQYGFVDPNVARFEYWAKAVIVGNAVGFFAVNTYNRLTTADFKHSRSTGDSFQQTQATRDFDSSLPLISGASERYWRKHPLGSNRPRSNRPRKRLRSNAPSWSFAPSVSSALSRKSYLNTKVVKALRKNLRKKMSYHKRGSKRRRTGSAYKIAKKALSGVKKLRKAIEVKVHDIAVNTLTLIGTAANIQSLGQIAGGSTFITRAGNSVTPFFYKLRFAWQGIANATKEIYRVMIFQDKKQVIATIPTLANVLASGSPLAQFNVLYRKRWNILYDQTFSMPSDTAIASSIAVILSGKMKGQIRWNSATATDHTLNGLYMLLITNQAGTDRPSFEYSFRLFYNDA